MMECTETVAPSSTIIFQTSIDPFIPLSGMFTGSESSGSSSSSSLVNLQGTLEAPRSLSSSSSSAPPSPSQAILGTGGGGDISPAVLVGDGRRDFPLVTVTRNEVFGRYIIATEDIPAGTVIVLEQPLAYGPDGDGCEGYEIPLCLGCCMIMNDDNEDFRCSKCQWPVCSEECEKLPAHADNECKFFSDRNISFPPDVQIATCYKGIQLLRALLVQSHFPEKWNELIQLQDWTELNCKTRDFGGLDEFRRDILKLPDDGFATLWNKMLGIFSVNSFSFMMKCESEDRSPSFGEFVFLTTSLFSHSCAANANWAIGCSPHFLMQVRSTVDIRKGEMISVPYTYDHVNFGTYGRVIRQQSFSCKCVRCLDPTELGTFNSAIKCYKCQGGPVLPLNPIDVKSEWKCSHCLSLFPGDLVNLFVEALADEVENCEGVDELEKFIETHRDKTLHENHWVLNLASNSILSNLAHQLHTLTKEQLDRFLSHCFYVLAILDVLAPGISLFRGNVLLLISRALLTKTELCIRQGQLRDKGRVVEEMKEVYSYQKAALRFWEEDHSYRPQNETYGPEAKDLLQEMSRVKNQYLAEVKDS